jgi:integrase
VSPPRAQPGTLPITGSDLARLERGLASLPIDRGRRTVEAILYTGVHPAALGHPSDWRMRVRDDGQLEWRRPKTKRAVFVPLPPDVRAWLPDLLAEYDRRPLHPTNLNQLVHATGALIGFPDLTPRGLRHTFGARAWITYRDVNLVMDWLGCDLRTVLTYVRMDVGAQKAEVIARGWSRS